MSEDNKTAANQKTNQQMQQPKHSSEQKPETAENERQQIRDWASI